MTTLSVDYLLFDLDGTLVFSNEAVEATWDDTIRAHNEDHKELPALDLETFLKVSHGTRTQELFKNFFPYRPSSIDDINDFEGLIVSKYGHFAKQVPGASALLQKLNQVVPTKWAIVTSGTRKLAHGWIETLFDGTKKPDVFVTANDVTNGKPNPEGYLKARATLAEVNNQQGDAIVFEDAPTGIKAGVNAGFKVVALATTFSKDVLLQAGASYVIKDMRDVDVSYDGKIEIRLQTL